MKLKKSVKFMVAGTILAVGGLFSQPVSASELATKIAGNKTYSIYKKISKKGVKSKKTTTAAFKYAHLESSTYRNTKHGRYWYLYANGRALGWVNEKFFARNKINIVKNISLVRNAKDRGFQTKDAINYVTDRTGSVVDLYKVQVSTPVVMSDKPGTYHVTYAYNGHTAQNTITVRSDKKEGITHTVATGKAGGQTDKTWMRHTKGSYDFYKKDHVYQGSNGMKLKTVFFQPNLLSLPGSEDTQVGIVPEGMTYADGWVTTSLYFSPNATSVPYAMGHLASYRLSAFDNKYEAQYIPTEDISFKRFQHYSQNIKVSPYLRLGHGQAIGSTAQYIYVVANYNKAGNPHWSNELIRIRKSDMLMDKIWTFKVAQKKPKDRRYFHNIAVIDDFTFYGLYHNAKNHRFEFWKISRNGDSFTSKQVGVINSDLITDTSQVQGFTYDQANQNFYIAFNDHIFCVKEDGTFVSMDKFDTGREFEGLSMKDGKLIVNMSQRAELMQAE